MRMLWLSFHLAAFLLGITAAIPMVKCFAPSNCLDTKTVYKHNKCRWSLGPETDFVTKLQAFWANAANSDGDAPLHRACWMSSPESVVKLLLERGADPNVRDRNGCTPLLIACKRLTRHEATIKVLLEYGANPTIADKSGKTPLHESLYFASQVKLLMKYGADPNAANEKGISPLQVAIEMAIKDGRYTSIVELLLSSEDEIRDW